ncbi:MAG: DUF2235 domain-containing protein [Hyphomicrobiaceae bacterium]|nr:DUF2235 domain-containing protein [Hyphomicrobiaceae bacterium]
MSVGSNNNSKAPPVQLNIRKGSLAVPIGLLLLTILLFIVKALPSGFDQLGSSLGITASPHAPLKLEAIVKAFETEDAQKKFWSDIKAFTAWDYVDKIGRPLLKVYLDQLLFDLVDIAKSLVATVLQLSAFSLIPGLAGMIYRRNFTRWFLISFASLMAINASGMFGSLTTAQPMPGSGSIFFFIVGQVIVLMLAYRLKRHARGPNLLPPRVHNWLLGTVLVLVGVACWQGWGPGYSAGASATQAGAGPAQPLSQSPSSQLATATPAATSAGNPAADTATAPPPAAKISVPESAATATGTRSWVWGFLGSGLTGWIYKWEFILLGLPLIYTLLRNSAAWTTSAPKYIVVCLDGTSNTPDQMEMGFLAQTNVFKLFRMLKADKQGMFVPTDQFDASLCKRYADKQIAFYYAGVGNKYDNDPVLQVLGLATGKGADDIVERAYLDIVRVYNPGDRIFICGFSRGAAITRLLARTIDARGAPRSVWTMRLLGKHRTLWTSPKRTPMPIEVLGCWDTVASFGVAKTIAGINFQQINLFKDLTIPDNVAKAYHMVALDEQRAEFEPTLMDPDPIRLERIVEVWFAGDHANVGGGWATDKLSDITLDFLLSRTSSGYANDTSKKAGDESWGLYLAAVKADKTDGASDMTGDGVMAVDPEPLGQVRHWFSNIYNYRPRKLPLHAVISETVFERMKSSVPVYAPQSLFDLNDGLDAKRDMIEAKVLKLVETRSLEEAEHKAMLEFKDKLRLTRWPDYWQGVVSARRPPPPELALANAVAVSGTAKV